MKSAIVSNSSQFTHGERPASRKKTWRGLSGFTMKSRERTFPMTGTPASTSWSSTDWARHRYADLRRLMEWESESSKAEEPTIIWKQTGRLHARRQRKAVLRPRLSGGETQIKGQVQTNSYTTHAVANAMKHPSTSVESNPQRKVTDIRQKAHPIPAFSLILSVKSYSKANSG